ncbi:late competence development ComFB family protein [Clostridium mobile]
MNSIAERAKESDTMIKNYMEAMVENLLPSTLNKYSDICKCEKCVDDIKAIALNNLKPLYVVTEKGNIFVKTNELNIQFKADVLGALTRAIEIVSENPKH